MQSSPTSRISRLAVAASIVMVLLAMLLPVCHLHPLLDKSAPDHCAICVSLHAALPMGVHLPSVESHLRTIGRVVGVCVRTQANFVARFSESRAPPPAC